MLFDVTMARKSPSKDTSMPTPNTPTRGHILYDAHCGICSRWVPFWLPTLQRLRLDIAPLQSPWVHSQLPLPPETLLSDIRLLFTDGQHLAGADVYRYVMRRTWWAYPLYLLSITPFLKSLFNAAYRAFARRRLRLSRACHLTPPLPTAEHPK
jgi:predicted DCC family thiol-disulfide oxidoreductase YuxK